MREWRVMLFFDCLTDFNLASLSRINYDTDDHTPLDHPKIPNQFYMHVTAFS